MADLEGVWTPENEDEMQFIVSANELAQMAHAEGVSIEEIAAGLNFLAASILMHDGEADVPPVPEPPDKVEDCPECETEIDSVRAFIGGECIVSPCGCTVHYTRVEQWVETPGGDDDG